MMDQQSRYKNDHFSVEFIGESQTDRGVLDRVLKGEVQLVYISPEKIIDNYKYRDMLLTPAYMAKLAAVIVDEAHCVKTWGDKFRRAFSKLGELRSIIPPGINVMALTATATQKTIHIIKNRLSMENPVVISCTPFRNNISYIVAPKISLVNFLSGLCSDLRRERVNFPKTIIFARLYSDCANMLTTMQNQMKSEIFEPIGAPNMGRFLLVDVFTRVNTEEKKEQILQFFKVPNSTLRVLIATTAFGMGVDCPNIRRVYHWGSPSEPEEYVQETGRAGRDGEDAVAIIFAEPVGKHASKEMKTYLSNSTVCRRCLLFQDFLSFFEKDITVSGIKCCDICQAHIEMRL